MGNLSTCSGKRGTHLFRMFKLIAGKKVRHGWAHGLESGKAAPNERPKLKFSFSSGYHTREGTLRWKLNRVFISVLDDEPPGRTRVPYTLFTLQHR